MTIRTELTEEQRKQASQCATDIQECIRDAYGDYLNKDCVSWHHKIGPRMIRLGWVKQPDGTPNQSFETPEERK